MTHNLTHDEQHLTCAVTRRTSRTGWPVEPEPPSPFARRFSSVFGYGIVMVLWVAMVLAAAGLFGSAPA